MRLIDIDDDRNCFIGMDGDYEKYNIDPDVLAEAKITFEDNPKIVRCRDCRYWHKAIASDGSERIALSFCERKRGGNGNDWFCADGKERE